MARRDVLWVDCGGGLFAGLVVLALSGWLARLYALPRTLVVGIAVANLAYGTYSFSLARRRRRPMPLIVLLVAANATWAMLCGVAAFVSWGTASPFGLAHLLGEGLFVGVLAAVEWTRRAELVGSDRTLEARPAVVASADAFDWSSTPQLSIAELLLATFVPSGLGMIGFHVVLPRVVRAGVPPFPAWLIVASVWLVGLVAAALWLLRREARALQLPLRTRLCLRRLTAREWGLYGGLMLGGLLLAVLPAQWLVPAFMDGLGLTVPAYMPFFLNPGIDPATADAAALSPGLPLRGRYDLLPLVVVALLLVILAEELYFRAWMLPKLSRYGAASWVINGVMFALYHTFQIWLLPPILAGSLLMAFVCHRSKSIWPPLVAHLVGNFVLAIAAMLALIVGR